MTAIVWLPVGCLVLLVVGTAYKSAQRGDRRKLEAVPVARQKMQVALLNQALTLTEQLIAKETQAVERCAAGKAKYRAIVDQYIEECSEVINRRWS